MASRVFLLLVRVCTWHLTEGVSKGSFEGPLLQCSGRPIVVKNGPKTAVGHP